MKKHEEQEPFYTGTLPDPAIGDAYDDGEEPAVFYAAFEEEPPPQKRSWDRLGLYFVLLLTLLCAGAYLARALPLLPPQTAALASAEENDDRAESKASQPTPPPEATPIPILPPQDIDVPAVVSAAPTYVRTALLVDGKRRGILISQEAAEALLDEICAYYEDEIYAAYDIEGELSTVIENDMTYESAPDTPDEELMSSEAMFTLLTEEKPLKVITTQRIEETEALPFESDTQKDAELLVGTSIVLSMGRDGYTSLVREVYFRNGKQRSGDSAETTQTAEAEPRVVRVGTQKLDLEKKPGKREGDKGPDTQLEFTAPVAEGDIVSNFGQRAGVLHLGLDYTSKEERAQVLAACGGTVCTVLERGGYGIMVEIDHGEGFVTRYAHLADTLVTPGMTVTAGQPIGSMGGSGNATERMLHFELRVEGIAYNPRYYVTAE